MSIKFSNVVLAALLSTCLFAQANATPILGLDVGGIYEDGDGLQWVYVGELDLGSGPQYDDANADGDATTGDFADALNGLEAAASVFGLPLESLALAAFNSQTDFNSLQTASEVVNHLAWYDSFWDTTGGRPAINRGAEDLTASVAGSVDLYDGIGDVSAFVSDRANPGEVISYVFKAVEVPEPSTLAIFSLALFGIGARRFKK